MPLEINDNLTTEKNKQENTPIMLYRVTIPDVSIVRAAEWDVDVEYNGETFIALPLKHEGISRNIMGEIDSTKITWSNINRQIGALLLNYDGLRGCQVDMILVFEDMLDDVDANITDTFWIDSSTISDTVATFIFTTRLDLFQLKIPCRMMNRDFCGWVFKKKGCYLTVDGEYVAPDGFLHADIPCDHTKNGATGCIYHNNKSRMGAFPGIPQKSIWVL